MKSTRDCQDSQFVDSGSRLHRTSLLTGDFRWSLLINKASVAVSEVTESSPRSWAQHASRFTSSAEETVICFARTPHTPETFPYSELISFSCTWALSKTPSDCYNVGPPAESSFLFVSNNTPDSWTAAVVRFLSFFSPLDWTWWAYKILTV